MARGWRFTVGAATYQLPAAQQDFWVEYANSGVPPKFSIIIHAAWERIGAALATPLLKRQAVEQRLLNLVDVVGKTGTLDIDFGDPGVKTFARMQLEAVAPLQIDNNLMIEYDLTFSFPEGVSRNIVRRLQLAPGVALSMVEGLNAGGGNITPIITTAAPHGMLAGSLVTLTENPDVDLINGNYTIAQVNSATVLRLSNVLHAPFAAAVRTGTLGLQGAGSSIDIQNTYFIVRRTANDKTVFKDVFRNVSVRIPHGPDVTTVLITGIRQEINPNPPVGDTAVRRQQKVELVVSDWIPQIGKEFLMTLDQGVAGADTIIEGTVHLQSVAPSKLDLPDAATFDLTFVKGYVQ